MGAINKILGTVGGVLGMVVLAGGVAMAVPESRNWILDEVAKSSNAYKTQVKENDKLRLEISELKTDIAKKQSEVTTLTEQKVVLLNTVTKIDNEINSTTDTTTLDNLQERKTAILNKVSSLNREINTLNNQINALNEQIEASQNSSAITLKSTDYIMRFKCNNVDYSDPNFFSSGLTISEVADKQLASTLQSVTNELVFFSTIDNFVATYNGDTIEFSNSKIYVVEDNPVTVPTFNCNFKLLDGTVFDISSLDASKEIYYSTTSVIEFDSVTKLPTSVNVDVWLLDSELNNCEVVYLRGINDDWNSFDYKTALTNATGTYKTITAVELNEGDAFAIASHDWVNTLVNNGSEITIIGGDYLTKAPNEHVTVHRTGKYQIEFDRDTNTLTYTFVE